MQAKHLTDDGSAQQIRRIDCQDIVGDFVESAGDCGKKRDSSKAVSMGKNAGIEFVESIFGRDRELENTEKLMKQRGVVEHSIPRDIKTTLGYELEGIMKRVEVLQQDESSKA